MWEPHRFENNCIEMNGVFYWNLPYLYSQLRQGFLAFKNADVGALDCFGIDTWGVDYGLLDRNGQLLSDPRSDTAGRSTAFMARAKTSTGRLDTLETAEKAAEIYMKIARLPRLQTITDDELHQLEARFQIHAREGYLD